MEEINARIDQLANLMQEFNLENAHLSGEDWVVSFACEAKKKRPFNLSAQELIESSSSTESQPVIQKNKIRTSSSPQKPKGEPLECPIVGIFYHSSSPGIPPYIKEGDHVIEKQVIGLVEAMKVFNEVTAPKDGIVSKYMVEHGQMVQPGDILLYIE